MTSKQLKEFQDKVYSYGELHFRVMPWRDNTEPYYVLVSEVMLQQTQVDRVIPKFENFIKRFPDVHALAEASLQEVLAEWSGLGYNRRGMWLHEAAKTIAGKFDGSIPKTIEELTALKGIGHNTAAAVLVYAFDRPEIFVETNIRTVYIHEFFSDVDDVHDKDIIDLLEKTLDKKNPRKWYWALMDYGVYLKREHGNLSRKSKHYAKQSKFEGSNRQLRGAILKELTEEPATIEGLEGKLLQEGDERPFTEILEALVEEGFIVKDEAGKYTIKP